MKLPAATVDDVRSIVRDKLLLPDGDRPPRIIDYAGRGRLRGLIQVSATRAAIDRIRIETFKHLLAKWSNYQTANGPLLDHSFAMWTSHVSTGPAHGFNNLPIIIAGNAGGYLKQGQYIDAGGATNTKVLNTLMTAMGLPSTSA